MRKPLWFVSASALARDAGRFGDSVEGDGDVAVGRGAVAGEPREARGNRCCLGLAFDVSRRAKSLERLRQKVEAGAAEWQERTGALEQEPRPLRIVGSQERERFGDKFRGRLIRGQRHRPLSCCAQRLTRSLHQARVVFDARCAR